MIAVERHAKTPAEVTVCHASCDRALEDAESITGTPTLSVEPAGGLTADSPAVTTADVEISGATVAVGRAVRYRVSGGTAGVDYVVTVSAVSDGTPAQTRHLDCPIRVEANGTP